MSVGITDPTIVKILLPKPFGVPFDYWSTSPPALGSYVKVPFGRQTTWGVVWSIHEQSTLAPEKIKSIVEVSPLPPLNEETRLFIQWVATYTSTPLGSVLKLFLGNGECFNLPEEVVYTLSGPLPKTLSKPRKTLIDLLSKTPALSRDTLLKEHGISPSVLKGLVDAGTLTKASAPLKSTHPLPLQFQSVDLNGEQQEAGKAIQTATQSGAFTPFLLKGVTGSGKTEVYFEGIQSTYEQGKQSLILVPEIALSTQWVHRFEQRFGCRPTLWHSDVSPVQKRQAWQAIATGTATVIVGARSALFLPYKNLGYMVVDEEHDHSYKQETGVIYQARDLAVMRAQKAQCPIVLSSATPSLETLKNAEEGKYHFLELPSRFGEATLPPIHLIDQRSKKSAGWISESLQKAILSTLERKEQALLFLNRRGYAPLLLCGACGHHMECPNCSTWLAFHKSKNRIQCHQCGYEAPAPSTCPSCGEEDSFIPCGPGVERIEEEVKTLFPKARLLLMTSDTLTSLKRSQESMGKIESGEVDIIIGTQIMAKGHHFPNLTLVGVIDGDLGLSGGDLRAAEKTYQLLHQVSGRAGRAEKRGTVLIQTHTPDHPVMQALHNNDYESFLGFEKDMRQMLHLPPYGKLAALILSGPNNDTVEQFARHLALHAPQHPDLEILGPTPAPLHKIQKRYRWRFLLKAPKTISLQKVIGAWLGKTPLPHAMKLTIDIDPYSFF